MTCAEWAVCFPGSRGALLRKAAAQVVSPVPSAGCFPLTLPFLIQGQLPPRLQDTTPHYLMSLGRGWQGGASSQRAGVTMHSPPPPLAWTSKVPRDSLRASPMDPITLQMCVLGHRTPALKFPPSANYPKYVPAERGWREDLMRCPPYLSSRQLQHHLGWRLLPHQRFQPEARSHSNRGQHFPAAPWEDHR